VEKSLAPRISPNMPHPNNEYSPSSVMGKCRSFIWRRYRRKAVAKAKTYISPYQRAGSPGIISGLSHEGKFTDNKYMMIIIHQIDNCFHNPNYKC